ncbi:hypothetical protein BCON_0971g00030 [Botryotinia convoluta]|uniref:Uncharacterized protein n=1 Tax=Botryotinia convoluta TaxID=54673 RepID=A0A4Z1H4S8_9HELO|nr:hypothetical protein BCON_0971g00030 [Botryotinia convoluta]
MSHVVVPETFHNSAFLTGPYFAKQPASSCAAETRKYSSFITTVTTDPNLSISTTMHGLSPTFSASDLVAGAHNFTFSSLLSNPDTFDDPVRRNIGFASVAVLMPTEITAFADTAFHIG